MVIPLLAASIALSYSSSSTARTTTTGLPCLAITDRLGSRQVDQAAKPVLGVLRRQGLHGDAPLLTL